MTTFGFGLVLIAAIGLAILDTRSRGAEVIVGRGHEREGAPASGDSASSASSR